MVDKVLKLDTVLGNNALMPTQLTGQEGLSIPFRYELTLASTSRDIEDQANSPAKSLVGTMGRIGILTGPKDTQYTFRTGMFSQFEKAGSFNPGGVGNNTLSLYRATLVPAVQMLGRQQAFRIFENQNVVTIINTILSDMQSRFPDFLFNTSRLDPADFVPMAYCVQYGESTFGFLTRLMERFGIWYIFDDPEPSPTPPGSSNDPVILGNEIMQSENVTMVLGTSPFSGFSACDVNTHSISDQEPKFSNQDPKNGTITNFRRISKPVLQNGWFGNFNILKPTAPVQRSEKLSEPQFNVLVAKNSVAGFFESEEFPTQSENDPGTDEDSPKAGQGDAALGDYAGAKMRQERAQASSVTGASANPTFKHGRTIKITADQNSRGEPGDYLITYMTISAFENSYLTTTGIDILNFFFRDFLFSPFQSGKKTRDFMLSGAVGNGLNNYLQNQQSNMLQNWWFPSKPSQDTDFLSFFAGGITTAGLTSAIPLLLSDIDKVIDQNDGGYANSFVAIQRRASGTYSAPTPPPGPRPIAYGPHLAVVIGKDGVDNKQEVFADVLGRVRVRFPWDPGPPASDNKLPPPWSSLDPPHTPFESGKNTCWVRVSEGWAGQQFGSQFLPRVGQEVLVGFIDGNPERPIVMGRVYNAATGATHLPFPNKDLATKVINKLSDLNGTERQDILRSGIKTRSIPQPSSGRGFNLLRFDDTGGSEQLLLRSQKRLDITALGTRYETIGGDRHMTVGGKQTTPTPGIGGDYIGKIYRHSYMHVGDPEFPTQSGNRITLIEQNDEIHVKKDSHQAIDGNWNTSAGGQATIDAPGLTGTIVLNATTNISITVGSSSIVITPSSIAITSPMVLINSGGPPAATPIDPSVDPPKDPTQADRGDSLELPKS